VPDRSERQPRSHSQAAGHGPALAASLLVHLLVIVALLIWVRSTALPPPEAAPSTVEIVFQAPAVPATETPTTPPVEAAPAISPVSPPPVEEAPASPPPPEPRPAEAAPPPPEPPPTPTVEAAPPAAAIPAPEAEDLPTPPIPPPAPPPEAFKPPPKPAASAVRPQPRPVAPAKPANPEPAPAASGAPAATAIPAPAEPPAPVSSDWRQALAAWLAAHKTYPEVARRRGEQGSVALRFSVERSGRVADVTVERGSGSAVLDAAAEAMLRNATVPAFPAAMAQDRISVTVQIRFRLTD